LILAKRPRSDGYLKIFKCRDESFIFTEKGGKDGSRSRYDCKKKGDFFSNDLMFLMI
jgi:hypothetical protein